MYQKTKDKKSSDKTRRCVKQILKEMEEARIFHYVYRWYGTWVFTKVYDD